MPSWKKIIICKRNWHVIFLCSGQKQLTTSLFFTGGVFVTVPNNVSPKELHRRILRANPVCMVTAPYDEVISELLDVVDQVRY